MINQKQVYFIVGLILIFSGCTLINETKTIPIATKKIEKPIEIKTKKIPSKKVPKKKKTSLYNPCNTHKKIMNHASKYIQDEFRKGYFVQNDIVGAKAQIFLIETNSKSIFSENINNAINSYNSAFSKAKKNRCNLTKYKISPLNKVKLRIKRLEKFNSKEKTK